MRAAGGLLLMAVAIAADGPPPPGNAWTLKYSDSGRESRFLDIPLHYGDWVPIDHAKALVEKAASRLTAAGLGAPAPPRQELPARHRPDQASERLDAGEPVYVSTRPQQQHRPQHRPQHRRPPPQHRRQDVRFPGQKHRPAHYPRQPQQHHTNNRRNRKLPPPKPHQNNLFRGKPQKQPASQPGSSLGFGFVPQSLQSFNPFKFFESVKPKTPTATFTTQRAQQQQQQEQSYLESLNAIQTIPAPDLSKFGPPVIELDSGADGQIILGQNYQFAGGDRDHLAGFVSLDFDGFTPGDRTDKKPKKQQEKEKLSILVGSHRDLKSNDQSDLVNFLNKNHDDSQAFVINSNNAAPEGFSKIDLPFMDPSKHKGFLPKAFIAPKGIPIPPGYKGKALPQRPEQVVAPAPGSWLEITTHRPVVLVTAAPEEVLKLQEGDSAKPVRLFERRPSTFLRPKPANPELPVTETRERQTTTETAKAGGFRFKLQKARPSYKEYLRNRQKAELIDGEAFSRPEKKETYKRKTEDLDRFYVNTKIEEARKEARVPTETTTTTFHLPSEHQQTNVFRLVSDSTIRPAEDVQIANDETDELVNTFFAAGSDNAFLGPDVDEETISIVYQPADDVAKSETTTIFSPTVLPALPETTASVLEQTVPDTLETTALPDLEVTTTPYAEEAERETSSTTTATTTTTTTTTAQPLPLSTKGPKTTQDPLDKLEALRKLKSKTAVYQGDLLSGEDIDAVTDVPIFNFARPRARPFKFKQFKNLPGLQAQLEAHRASGGANSPLPGFGIRTRKRKRPFWQGGRFGQGFSAGLGGSVEPTVRPGRLRTRLVTSPTQAAAGDDTEVVVKNDEVKGNLKPFFEQFYKEIVGEGGARLKGGRRYGIPRRRSTTAAPPPTVGGPQIQIYEVHPKTRLRVTTRRPLTTEQKLPAADPTTDSLGQESSTHEGSDYFTYQEDYVYEPTTEAGEDGGVTTGPFADITPRLYEPAPRATTLRGKADQTTTEIDSLSTAQPTTISQIVSTTEPSGASTQQGEVHETADKHSTTTQVPEEAVTEVTEDNEIDDGSVVKADAVSEEELELLTLDIASSLSNEIVDQVYEESQVVETTFKGKAETEEHTVANGRLTSYEKNIDTSQYGVDKDYSKEDLEVVVNEHGQQQLSTEKDTHSTDWRAVSVKPYHEIKRNEGDTPTVSIEEVEITESKDYSEPDIIYDLSRDSFDSVGNPDSFSVPVSVAFNVPEKPTTTLRATEATTELTNPTTTYIAEEPTTIAATTERHYRHYNPTTYSRIYSLINRNKRPFTSTASPAKEVHLGTTGRSSLDLTGAQTVGPTTAEATVEPTEKTYETAHKVPGRLWSAYEISRHAAGETTTEEIEIEPVPERSAAELDEEISVDGEHDEINTEGFNLASIMSYSMPDENSNATALPGILEIDDLPKANEHESQVLVIEQVAESATNNPALHKLPKAIDFAPIPLRQKERKKKFATKTKKREEWIKNWVDRKYNKPKFPRAPLLPLAPAHTQQETNVQTTTEEPQEGPSIQPDSAQNEPQHSLLVPTIPPKITSDVLNLAKIGSAEPTVQPKQPGGRFNVNLDVTVRDGSSDASLPELAELKSSLLEKYSSSRYKKKNKNKNSLFHREEVKSSPVFGGGVVRGADTDLFRSYGGKSLSQSDFERQILGVSTQTEISVKSMICVKGQCFNADDMGTLLSK